LAVLFFVSCASSALRGKCDLPHCEIGAELVARTTTSLN
jgi:hypothetical protein